MKKIVFYNVVCLFYVGSVLSTPIGSEQECSLSSSINVSKKVALQTPTNAIKNEWLRAASNGDSESVVNLKDRYAVMDVKDIFGKTALMIAARNGHTECVQLLLEREGGLQKKDGETALMIAARSGYVECVKLLLEKEGEIQDRYGNTALIIADAYNDSAVIDILLSDANVCEASIEKLKATICSSKKLALLNRIYDKHPDLA